MSETKNANAANDTEGTPIKQITVTVDVHEIEILERRIVPTGSGETFLPL